MCIPMPLMKPLLIPHWGNSHVPNVYPIGRMCVILELMPYVFAEKNNASGVVMITIDTEGTNIEKLNLFTGLV